MPSEGGHYWMSQPKLSELLMYLSDMYLDGRMSEDDYNKVAGMVTVADEEAYTQKVYVTQTWGYENATITGIFTDSEFAHRNLKDNEDTGYPDSVSLYKLNDPDFVAKSLRYVGEDEWGEAVFEETK